MSKILTRESVFAGSVLDVAVETHRMPDGRSSRFEIIRHPGGAPPFCRCCPMAGFC